MVRDTTGSAAIELALMASLVVAAVVLTVAAVGDSSSSVFEVASSLTGDASGGLKRTTQTADQETESQEPSQAVVDNKPVAAVGPGRMRFFGAVGAALLIVGCGGALVVQRRRIRELERRTTILPAACPVAQAAFVSKRQDIFRSLLGDLESFLTDNVRVLHLMTTEVVTVGPTASCEAMVDLMREKQMRHLLVVDSHGKLLGVVSDRDLRAGKGVASDVMANHPHVCSPETPVRAAVTMLLQSHISSLPVVEGERLVGILTMSDVGMALQCILQLVERVTGGVSGAPQIAAALVGRS